MKLNSPLSLVLLLANGTAMACELPAHIRCREMSAAGLTVDHAFDLTQDPREIWPPIYHVDIQVSQADLLNVGGDPDQSVSSDDPQPVSPWEIIIDLRLQGRRGDQDPLVVNFDGAQGGFIRYDYEAAAVTYQLPGELLPRYVPGCDLPEAGVTVHN